MQSFFENIIYLFLASNRLKMDYFLSIFDGLIDSKLLPFPKKDPDFMGNELNDFLFLQPLFELDILDKCLVNSVHGV